VTLNPWHESHIRRGAVYFDLTAPDLDPKTVTKALGISSDQSAKRGDERRNFAGQLLLPHEVGYWRFSTLIKSSHHKKLHSKDINDRFRYLLGRLLPHRNRILAFAREEELSSTYCGNPRTFTPEPAL
jgi:hypothetical protein